MSGTIWRPLQGNMKSNSLSLGAGENTFGSPFAIAENESRYSRNLSPKNYPALHVRAGRSSDDYTALNLHCGMGNRDNHTLLFHDGDTGNTLSSNLRVTKALWGIDMMVAGTVIYYVYMFYDSVSTKYQIATAVMNTVGTGWVETVRTTSAYDKYYPKLYVGGAGIYYVWYEKDAAGKKQIWTATSALNGTGWAATKQTTSDYNKEYPQITLSGTTLYYVWQELDGSYYQIWTATSALDGTSFSATERTTSAYDKTNPLQILTGTDLHYAWSESNSDGSSLQIWIATMTTAGAGWTATEKTTSLTQKYLADMTIAGTVLYYLWEESDVQVNYEDNFQLWHGKMDTAGTNWAATKLTNTKESSTYNTGSKMKISGSFIYYFWSRTGGGTDLMFGNSALDGSRFSFLRQYYGTGTKYPVAMYILSGVVYYCWDNATGLATAKWTIAQSVWKRRSGYSSYTNIRTGLALATSKMMDFVTGTTRSSILMNGTDKYAWNGTTVTDLTNAPASNKFTIHDGRIYVATETNVKFCALNLINDWTTVNDAGSISITKARGILTAITTYDSNVYTWTELSMHVLFGTGPIDYRLDDVKGGVGCISDRSVIVCNGVLYWITFDGVYAYDGSPPRKISHKMDEYFLNINTAYKTEIVTGTVGNYIYFAIPYGSAATGNNLVLMYDTEKGAWYPETGNFVNFETLTNILYGVDSTETILNMASGTTDAGTVIPWSWISGPMLKNSVKDRKTLKDLWVVYDLPAGSTLNISVSSTVDASDFTVIDTYSGTANEQTVRSRVDYNLIQNVNYFRIKFDGTGPCSILALEQLYRQR